MLDSINCEPYGYTKYHHDDVDNIIVDEVKDFKHITEEVKVIKDLTLNTPTNITLNKF